MPAVGIDSINLSVNDVPGALLCIVFALLVGRVTEGFVVLLPPPALIELLVGRGVGFFVGLRVGLAVGRGIEVDVAVGPFPLRASITIRPFCT